MVKFTRSLLAASLLFVPLLTNATESNPAEAKLREALRNTTLQLRTIQGERDTLEAAKTQLEQEKQTLSAQLETLSKKAASDQETATQRITTLETKSGLQEAEIARLEQALAKWKVSQQEATALAASKEAARAKLAQHAIELQRRVSDQQTRNVAMYKVGTEILGRYENFGLGTALTAREPFVGTMRVKLENLVQDYADKLSEQRIAPEPAATSPAKPGTSAKPAPAPANSPTAGPRNIGTKPISDSGKPASTKR